MTNEEIIEKFEYLYDNRPLLTYSDEDWLDALFTFFEEYHYLSDKQIAVLNGIEQNLAIKPYHWGPEDPYWDYEEG